MKHHQAEPETNRVYWPILLSITVALTYFVFHLVAIVSTYTLDGACLYTFWTPFISWWKNPYWLVVIIVVGLGILAVTMLFDGIRRHQVLRWFTGGFVLLLLAFWGFGLRGLWDAMEYERGNLSADEWFRDKEAVSFAVGMGGMHECRAAT